MTELVRGLAIGEAEALHGALARLVEGGAPTADLDPRLRAFERLRDLPSRRRCALLAWEALEAAIEDARPA